MIVRFGIMAFMLTALFDVVAANAATEHSERSDT